MDNLLVRHYGEIEQGKLHIFNLQEFKDRIREVGNRKVTLEIHVREGSISHQMRRYYFGVLLKEAQLAFWNAGYEFDLDTIDHTFRMKALYKEVLDEEKMKYVKEPHSLKDVDTEVTLKQFMYYIEYIIRYLVENLDHVAGFPNEILTGQDLTESQLNKLISAK